MTYVVDLSFRFLVDAEDEDAALEAALDAADVRDRDCFIDSPELTVDYVGSLSDQG